MKDISSELELLAQEIEGCHACPEAKDRNKTVPGEGDASSGIIILGEGPSERGNELGRPFVGRSKSIFEKILASIHLDRRDVFLLNIVKCRGKEKNPSKDMVKRCSQWTWKQITVINPRIIVTFGAEALKFFFPDKKLSECHGKILNYGGNLFFPHELKVLPIVHPMKVMYDLSQMRGHSDEDYAYHNSRSYKEMAADISLLLPYILKSTTSEEVVCQK